MKDIKETKKIIDEIKKNDLSAGEIENIFSALRDQKNFVGGKIWTTADVKDQVYYSIDENEPRKSIIYSKAVKLFIKTDKLKNKIDYDSEEEYIAFSEAIDDAIQSAMEALYEEGEMND